jgi:2-polyprenyl-3-methyl-5-hydroxy-6-metoxy-1,4-benzoquinol methylase
MRNLLRRINRAVNPFRRSRLLREQNRFILYELRRVNEMLRQHLLESAGHLDGDARQTRASFDHQWRELPSGVAMPDDAEFMKDVDERICGITGLEAGWFPGKRVVDIGCGAGRFSCGLLSLGATVLSCDQSEWALERTAAVCAPHAERHSTRLVDLLAWEEAADFDLAFCFGVVHHTGNTYLAIRNAANKVKSGGRLFLMVYGFPEGGEDFAEINSYEALRQELRHLPFDEKARVVLDRFGPRYGHGWFDAVSPRVNDLLTFEEIRDLLGGFGFGNVRRTLDNRNHHVIADRT